ncbi:MAG TPA: wax ester/triacylglycerol synthase family O-acyltransferase, partial [Acidimicrobiia bacterium]
AAEHGSWHLHVCALIVLEPVDGPIDAERIRESFVARLPLVPEFACRPQSTLGGLQRPTWEPMPDFDPRAQVHIVDLPHPADEAELYERFARIAAVRLDRSRPLWDLTIIRGYKGDQAALVFKAHHALVDGVTGMEIALLLLDPSPDAAQPDVVAPDVANLSPAQRALRVAGEAVRAPLRFARFGANVTRSLVGAATDAVTTPRAALPVVDAPHTPLNGDLSTERRFAVASTDFTRLSATKSAAGVTVNELFLAACGGALREYLETHGGAPDRPLVSAVPVSLHDETTTGAGSRVAWLFVALPTHLSNPMARVEFAHTASARAKALRQATAHHRGPTLGETVSPLALGLLARAGAGLGLGNRIPPGINVLISSVAGPATALYIGGARVASIYPMGPLLMNYGLNITALRYCDRFDVGVLSCPNRVDKPSLVAQQLANEFDVLAAAVGV